MPADSLVIIPTYNEKDNLHRVVEAVLRQGEQFDVLVVDDASPDGTGELAETLRSIHSSRVRVLHRATKCGLGSAYREAFIYGRTMPYATYCQMDADGSHPAELLPKLRDAAMRIHGGAIASRRVKGGGSAEWGWYRNAMSNAASTFARGILGLAVQDPTSGYRCYTRAAIDVLLNGPLESNGYVFQVEATYRCRQAGVSLQEVPFTFTNRLHGKSKLGAGIISEFFWIVMRLRLLRK